MLPWDRVAEFEGVTENGVTINAKGITFTYRQIKEGVVLLVGIAQQVERIMDRNVEDDDASIRCDLTNFSLRNRMPPIGLHLGDFEVQLFSLNWGNRTQMLREHAKVYQYAMVASCLKVDHVAPDQEAEILDHLQEVAFLLSIACRGHVDIVAQHVQKAGKLHSTFIEPTFTEAKWIRPLIPDEAIADFLQDVYPLSGSQMDHLAIGYAIEHYLKALTMESAWPLSAGIFTAMEALKTAFFAQNQNNEEVEASAYWVVPYQDFVENHDMINDILNVLRRYFERFGELQTNERDSLKAQIKGLHRRSYKTQLRWMLEALEIEPNGKELQNFINARNDVIHRGSPVPLDSTPENYDANVDRAWRDVCNAIALFERTLLAFLKYNHDSPRELFNQQPTL